MYFIEFIAYEKPCFIPIHAQFQSTLFLVLMLCLYLNPSIIFYTCFSAMNILITFPFHGYSINHKLFQR